MLMLWALVLSSPLSKNLAMRPLRPPPSDLMDSLGPAGATASPASESPESPTSGKRSKTVGRLLLLCHHERWTCACTCMKIYVYHISCVDGQHRRDKGGGEIT